MLWIKIVLHWLWSDDVALNLLSTYRPWVQATKQHWTFEGLLLDPFNTVNIVPWWIQIMVCSPTCHSLYCLLNYSMKVLYKREIFFFPLGEFQRCSLDFWHWMHCFTPELASGDSAGWVYPGCEIPPEQHKSKNNFPIHATDEGQILSTHFDSTPMKVFPGLKFPESRVDPWKHSSDESWKVNNDFVISDSLCFTGNILWKRKPSSKRCTGLVPLFLELSFSDINGFGHLLRKGVNYISHFCLGIGNLEPACTVG